MENAATIGNMRVQAHIKDLRSETLGNHSGQQVWDRAPCGQSVKQRVKESDQHEGAQAMPEPQDGCSQIPKRAA